MTTGPKSIEAVIFDFGGVITTSPFEAFARYERANGLPDGFIRTVNATNPTDNAWARLERGELDIDGFAEAFEAEATAAGHPVDGYTVLGLLAGDVRPEMVEAVRRCREKLSVALLTNNFAPMGAANSVVGADEVAPLLDLFHVVVESSKVGVRKPDPAIYRLVCEQLGVAPANAAFLDDLGVNLKPARAMGMTTIKVVNSDDALSELEGAIGFSLR